MNLFLFLRCYFFVRRSTTIFFHFSLNLLLLNVQYVKQCNLYRYKYLSSQTSIFCFSITIDFLFNLGFYLHSSSSSYFSIVFEIAVQGKSSQKMSGQVSHDRIHIFLWDCLENWSSIIMLLNNPRVQLQHSWGLIITGDPPASVSRDRGATP